MNFVIIMNFYFIQLEIKISKIKKKIKVFILVGEDSGDFIASCIIRGFQKSIINNYEFFGVCGERMKSLNVNQVFHYSEINFLGFKDVFLNYMKLRKKVFFLANYIFNLKPDVVITIDSKLFSLNLAKLLKKKFMINNNPIPLVHIVLPTIWAHSPKRALKWKGVHDKLFSIIPNEKKYFDKYLIQTKYLGNPFFEKLIFKKNNKIKKENDVCLVLPGSREKEINYNIFPLLEAIKIINKNFKNITWVLPTLKVFNTKINYLLKNNNLHKKIKVIDFEKNYDCIINSKLAIACSGTVTLELALAGVPTIGIYKTDWLSAFIGKRVVNLKNVILPNFIIGREIIPFLFQEKCNAFEIFLLFKEYYTNIKLYKDKFSIYSDTLLKKTGYKNFNEKNKFGKQIAKEISKLID